MRAQSRAWTTGAGGVDGREQKSRLCPVATLARASVLQENPRHICVHVRASVYTELCSECPAGEPLKGTPQRSLL